MIEHVFVINLDRSPGRWRDMQPILARMGFPGAVRFPGVDGAAVDIAAAQRTGLLPQDLSGFDIHSRAGEIGCALSHAAVLREIVAHRIPAALIFEDDVLMKGRPANWRARAERAFADLPDGWDIWFLFRCFDIRRRAQRLTARTVKPYSPQSCAAYAVSCAGAQKILANLDPPATAVDRVIAPLVKSGSLHAYAASPQLIEPGLHPSIINAGNTHRRWVRNGVNRPPEYWPSLYLPHLGEAPEPWVRRTWEALVRRWKNGD